MKEFFLIIFFSKTVLLTPAAIDLDGNKELLCTPPLVAITSGASIQVDVTNLIDPINFQKKGISEIRKSLREKIPEGTLTAELIGSNGEKIQLRDTGIALSPQGARVILASPLGVPTKSSFTKVLVSSQLILKGVNIYWKNYAE